MKQIHIKTVIGLLLGCVVVLSQSTAVAQLGLPKKKSAGGGGEAAIDKNAFGKSADQAADNLLAARIEFLDAKASMMDALGLKTDSLTKASEALRAKEGTTSDKVKNLESAAKTTAEANKEFEAKMAESKELSAESKAKFTDGAVKFIAGVVLEKQQIETIQKLVQQGQAMVQSASPLDKAGAASLLKPVTTMSTIVPGDVKEGSSTLSKIVKFCATHKIELPKNATDKLGELASN